MSIKLLSRTRGLKASFWSDRSLRAKNWRDWCQGARYWRDHKSEVQLLDRLGLWMSESKKSPIEKTKVLGDQNWGDKRSGRQRNP